MQELYEFEYKDMEFSKDGSLDELIALDRYAVPTYDGYEPGDTVVAIVDEKKETKAIGEILSLENNILTIKDRYGDEHKLHKTLALKPLELKPSELWERWAKGASSVEQDEFKKQVENELRWLFDGFRYSPGGRIQLMNGQEFRTGKKAQLTSFNCFVVPSAQSKDMPLEQFLEVMRIAYIEANIQRRGGGTGTNISFINTVSGCGLTKDKFIFYLPESHPDYEELMDAIKLGKFEDVIVAKTSEEFSALIAKNNSYVIAAIDSVDDMFNQNAVDMVEHAYKQESVAVNFAALRGRNALVKSVNGRSSGARTWMELFALIARLLQLKEIDCVDFAELYSFVVKLITQGGSR